MRVDPEVQASKYHAEVAILRRQRERLQSLGSYLVRAEFPEIDVLVVPTRKLSFGTPIFAGVSAGGIIMPGARSARIQRLKAPPALSFAAPMAFGVRFALDDFDLRAPSVTFRHPSTWVPLQHEHIPPGILVHEGKNMLVVHAMHPATKLPFFCMAGVREYHEHPQHTGDEWLLYRGSLNVFATLSRIVECCCTNIAPVLVVGQNNISVQWES